MPIRSISLSSRRRSGIYIYIDVVFLLRLQLFPVLILTQVVLNLLTILISDTTISLVQYFFGLSNYTTCLVILNLSFNNLTSLIPNVIKNTSPLTYLDLSYNMTEGGNSNSFAKTLYLGSNNLSGQF